MAPLRTLLSLSAFSLALACAPCATRAQDAAAAEALVAARGCTACHSLDGTPRVGPSFASAANVPRAVSTPTGPRRVVFDTAYIRRAILEPDAELAAGHGPGTMPRLARDAADAERLSAAVWTLASRPPPAPAVARSPLWLLFAVLAFVVGHLFLSSGPVRGPLVRRLGENGFSGAYSLVVLAALAWMIFEWRSAPYVELFRPAGWTRWVPNLVMPISYTLLVAGFTSKNPTNAGMASAAANGPSGWARITRHPSLWGFALWALSHLVTNGDLRSLLLMGGITLLAFVGMAHIDRRRRATGAAAWAAFEQQTSVIPFLAIARGAPRPTLAELGWWRIAAGVGGWLVMLFLHSWLIGVSPFP